MEHYKIFKIVEGGPINFIVKDFTLDETKDGFFIGTNVYDNINIEAFTFEVYNDPVVLENIEHDLPLTKAAVIVRNCFFNGGRIGINYDKHGQAPTEYSPYAAARNNTGVNLEKFIIYTPKAEIAGHSIFVLGNDEISENLSVDCLVSNPKDYWAYESPVNIAQKDVNEADALITGNEYCDKYGQNCTIFDGENCFIADANAFLLDGITPRRDSKLNLKNGYYIGAIPPLRRYKANINYDDYVDDADLKIFAGTWLDQGLGDLNEDSITDFKDYAILANDYGKEEPLEPE